MSLHPDVSDPALLQYFDNVRSESNPLNWVLYGYVPKTDKIRVDASGNGGLSEMTEEMSDGKVHYGFIRYNLNGTFKFVYIAWCGEGVTGIRKGSFTPHAVDMGKFLDGYHVQINARNEEDLDETTILARVKTATSSHGRRNEKAKVQGSTGPDPTPKQPAPKRDIATDMKAESDAFWEKQRAEEAEDKRQKEEAQRNRNAPQSSGGRNMGKMWEEKQQQAPAPVQTRQAPVGGNAAKIAASFNSPPPAQTPPKAAPPPPQPVHSEPEHHDDWGTSAPEESHEESYENPPEEPEQGGYDAGGGQEEHYAAPEEPQYGGGEEQSYGGGEEPQHGGEEQGGQAGIQCRALYTYQGENEGDLSFNEGDIIMVLDQSNPDGWWEGELNGQTGFFPSNFVAQV